MDNYESRISKLEVHYEDLMNAVHENTQEVKELRKDVNRYKGFFGGIIFIASGIATFLSMFGEWIQEHWK